MCGILGVFERRAAAGYERSDLRAWLAPGLAALTLRGPDGEGRWVSSQGDVALGHRRLSIVDLSERGAQPMQRGSHVVTFNGEIYNYKALRAELESRSVRFESDSDTEVLLHLYAAHGADMVHKLRGMFAFALWDAQREQLFLARDPYGIKPLYYTDDGNRFAFASQVRALIGPGTSHASREIDNAALAGFYLLGSVPEPLTILRGVRALPAGTSLVITRAGAERARTFFSIAETYANAHAENEGKSSSASSAALLREAVLDSVRHHLMADVPVGAFLSAGIDSGALLGLMRDAKSSSTSEPVHAVTLVFDEHSGRADDEGPLASEVAKLYGAQHTLRKVDRAELERDLPAFLGAMDQPTVDGVNTWFVSKAAAERGLKVAISGLGGDELFGGYPAFRDVPRWAHRLAPLSRVPGLARAASRLSEPLLRHAGLSPKAALLLEHGGTFEGAYLARRGLFTFAELPALMGKERAIDGLQRLDVLAHIRARRLPDPGSDFGRIAALESALYMRNQLLRDADWASMAHSLEVRVPLVDASLLRAVASVVSSGCLGSAPKHTLARCPITPLPEHVIHRAKTGFTTPVEKWLRSSEPLQAWRTVPALRDDRTHWARRYAYCIAQAYERGIS